MNRIAERVSPFGWHLQFSPIDLEHWLDVCPYLAKLSTDVVVDHMAWRAWNTPGGLEQPGFQQLIDLVATGRVWVKIAAPERFSKAGGPSFADVTPYARTPNRSSPRIECSGEPTGPMFQHGIIPRPRMPNYWTGCWNGRLMILRNKKYSWTTLLASTGFSPVFARTEQAEVVHSFKRLEK